MILLILRRLERVELGQVQLCCRNFLSLARRCVIFSST
ncbi:F-box protein [Candidatus Omnitrophota bacterium]